MKNENQNEIVSPETDSIPDPAQQPTVDVAPAQPPVSPNPKPAKHTIIGLLKRYIPDYKILATIAVFVVMLGFAAGMLLYSPKSGEPVSNQADIAGVNVGNLSQAEALSKLENTASNQQVTIHIDNQSYTFAAKDLGIRRDVSPIVEANYTKPTSNLDKLVIKKNNISTIKTYINEQKLISSIEQKLGSYKIVENASVVLDGENFVVREAKTGIKIDFSKIKAMAEATSINVPINIKAELTKTEPLIPTSAATEAKAKADEIVARDYSISTQANGSKYATRLQKMSWINFSKDEAAKTINTTVNIATAKATITGLANGYKQNSKERTTVAINGSAPVVINKGQDGIALDGASLNNGLAELEKALNDNQPYVLQLGLVAQAAPERNLGSVNGGKFVLVDVPKFRAYAIENSNIARTMLISTGTPSMPTPAGHFKIMSKTPMMDMKGCNKAVGCWTVPNVPNVQYFTGEGHAFHGAYWHNKFGQANLSHGCVNLPLDDAAWLFGWTEVGTDVIVVK